jgi:peptidase E
MTTPHLRTFWIALAVLLLLHSVVSFASYRIFTRNDMKPGDEAPVVISTSAGQVAIRSITKRTATPMPVIFYICGGYAGLVAVVLVMIYHRLHTM